ncbi:MAG: hypothetical protein AAF622_16035, partial [Cyanobacteria bacterium P01_C01_bin.147]
ATEAMSLQGRPKVGLIIHCQELNAYVLSAGTILFVQNQNLSLGIDRFNGLGKAFKAITRLSHNVRGRRLMM